jgi:hypothetical protein
VRRVVAAVTFFSSAAALAFWWARAPDLLLGFWWRASLTGSVEAGGRRSVSVGFLGGESFIVAVNVA